jgi:uncharacterized protein involved in outer membrane biogenesis
MLEENRRFRRLPVIVTALVTLLVIVVLAGSLLLPSHLIGPRIAKLVQQKTGRELRIAGSISFSLLPRFGLVAHDVHLSSPAGGFSHDFLSADEIHIGLDPSALLRGEILVDYLSLSHPSMTFEIDANGEKNWIFHPLASAPSSVAEPTSHAAVTSFAASGMTIASGMLSYINGRSRVAQAVTDMDLILSMKAFEQPLDAKGNLTYNGEPLAISVTLNSPKSLQDGDATSVTLGLAGQQGSLHFNGIVQDGMPFKAAGSAELKTPALRDLLAWAGIKSASDIEWLGDFSIAGQGDLVGDRLSFADASITLDGVESRGGLDLIREGKRFDLSLNDVRISSGSGSAKLSIDTGLDPPAIAASGQLTGVTFNRLPVGIGGFESLRGTGDLAFDVAARGKRARELIALLSGTANVNFTDGSIQTDGLGGLKNHLGFAGDKIVPRQIEYQSLSASATIAQGVLHNNDLRLVGPRLSATGSGILDLAPHRMDYEWQPDIVGLGNARIAISGDWDNPNYDVKSLNITKGPRSRGLKLP